MPGRRRDLLKTWKEPREEVQQKIDDKLTSLVGQMLHNDKLSAGIYSTTVEKLADLMWR